MKKLFLLGASAFISLGAFGQSAQSTNDGPAKQALYPYQIKDKHVTAGKSAQGGGRWYEHYAVVEELTQTMSNSLMPIWFDSTVLQNFTSGLGTINFSSALQVIDPMYFTLWDDTNLPFIDGTDISVEPWDNYSVDSVFFAGAYVKNTNRSANIVDTLILSVSATSSTGTGFAPYYYTSAVTNAWATNYVNATGPDSLLMGYTILDVDSVNRCSGVAGRVMWKVPLDSNMRQQDSAGFVDIQTWALPVMVGGVPGSVNIPAGKGIAFTVTFKSGDVWPVNVDTFSEYHHFSLYEGEGLGAGQLMPYYRYNYQDRNMSNLMFSTNPTRYSASIFIEGNNTAAFRQEFHYMGAHVVCNSCYTLGVKEVNGDLAASTMAYPNPAADEVNIKFSINTLADATVSLTNAVGQTVASEVVKNAGANADNKVTFSTSHLPSGIYFYTVDVNGQRTSGRVSVAH